MLHAKAAVADERWARVGSSNLNVASWLGNWELDVAVEDETFGAEMARMYLDDLDNRDRNRAASGAWARRERHRARTTGHEIR